MEQNIEIRLSGSGGQGLMLAASILSTALVAEGRTVAQSQSYEPTSRGGLSRSDLVVSDGPADYPLVTGLDYLVILDQVAVAESKDLIRDGAVIVTDSKMVTEPPKGNFRLVQLPMLETAIGLGNRRIANTIALSVLASVGKLCDRQTLEKVVTARSPKAFLDLNQDAMARGWEMAAS
ncbi:MAG TPA: pyruvate ferredoxin oxidoreductase [Rhizobiales bacterium]|nr:pyruvate ferredoxin oxidoreductase [Hyphomicrobiales bacterium]